MSSSSSTGAEVWVGASSPLLVYSPYRNGASGSSWVQGKGGTSQCSGSATFAVELQGMYFSSIDFIWSTSTSFSIKAGLDGALDSGSFSSGMASLPTSFGSHSARLECYGEGSASSGFELLGVRVQTLVVSSGTGTNATLDDASSEITYTGFQSSESSQSSVAAIQSGSFYQNTVSYTSSGDASATFKFQGSAIYAFGMTGPEFGCFTIVIDGSPIGTYNASTTILTYSTLLFFTTYLDPSAEHSMTITNQNDGMMLALDYFVCVQEAGGSGGTGTLNGGTTVTGTAGGSEATVDWGNGNCSTGGVIGKDNGGSDSTPAVIGGILGGLAALLLLWVWWRYRQWNKAGGTGSFWTAFCGGSRKKAAAAKAEKKEFALWPMIWSRPKYDTTD